MFDDDTEENSTDTSLSDFESEAQQVFSQAPDADSGLTVLRNLYGEREFADTEQANTILGNYSDQVRKKFGDTQAYDEATTLQLAPIDLIDIVSDKKDPEENKIDTINRWETENLKALAESQDPSYIQAKSQLERGIKQSATRQRREFYGTDNYLVDGALRFTQGAVGPIAEALPGGDSVNDWFTEHENADMERDHPYWAAIESGAGSGIAAIGAGVATGGWGTTAYLTASGIGSVKKTIFDSLENEGTADEALTAGTLEAANQVIQIASGEKIFGGAAEAIVKGGEQLGSRIFVKSAQNAALGAGTAGLGSMLSIEAKNIGEGRDDDITEGLGPAIVSGGLVGGFATAGAEYLGSRKAGSEPGKPGGDSGTGSTEAGKMDADLMRLQNTIEDTEGSPPPVAEMMPKAHQTVDVPDASPVATLKDGSMLVQSGDNLHYQAGDKTLSAHDEVFYVAPEVAEKLRAAKAGNAPDGSAIALSTEDGQLHLESDFLNPDLSIAPDKTGAKKRVVPTNDDQSGVPVFVNRMRTEDGIRQPQSFIAPSEIDPQSIGAARLNAGRKESQTLKKYRETYGEEDLLKRGLLTETEGGNESLYTDLPDTNKEQAVRASEFLNKNGIYGSLDHLQSLADSGRYNADDSAIASVLDYHLQDLMIQADKAGDYDRAEKLSELHTDALLYKAKIGTELGRGLQVSGERAQREIAGQGPGDVQILKINLDLKKQAQERINADPELGPGTTLKKLHDEVIKADEVAAAAEKEVNNPAEAEALDLDAQIERAGQEHIQKNYEEPIKEHEKLISKLEVAHEKEKADVKNQLSEADQGIKTAIDDTHTQIKAVENEIAERTTTPLEPTKAQVDRENHLKERIDTLRKRADKLEKALKEPVSAKATEKQKAAHERKIEEAKAHLEDVKKKTEDTHAELEAHKKEVAARQASARPPTSEQLKKLNALKSRLTNLNKQFETVKTQNPKQANSVKKIRSEIAESKRAIRKLTREKKLPKEPTAKQQKLQAKKNALFEAKAEGRLIVTKEVKNRLIAAKNAQAGARERLSKAENIFRETLQKFKPEDQEQLKKLNKLMNTLPPGETKRAVATQMFKVKSKYLSPNSPFSAKRLYNFWRGNVLTGWTTHINNAYSNLSNAASTAVATTVTGVLRGSPFDGAAYIGGWLKGVAASRHEIIEIAKGNRGGRQKLEMEGAFEPVKLTPLNAFGQMSLRLLSASDSLFHRGAASGQAYLVEHIAATQAKVPVGERRAWVENKLYNTTEKLAKIRSEIEDQATTLKQAGVKMSERQKQIAIFERAESLRDQTTKDLAERGGDRATYIQEGEGVIGLLGDAIQLMGKSDKFTFTLGGQKVNPFEYTFPFVKTVGNVANAFLDHTPIGFIRAANKAGLLHLGENFKYAKTSDGRQVSLAIEARQTFGQALIGTSLLSHFFAMAMAHKDDKEPWLQFYGDSAGDYKKRAQENIPDYSLRMGDSIFPLGDTVLALLPALIDGGVKSIKSGASNYDVIHNMAISSLGAVADLSFIKSAGDLFKSIHGGQGSSDKASLTALNQTYQQITSFASGFVPGSGFLRNVSKTMEASPIETFNNFQAKMLGQFPVTRELGTPNKPQLNLFGEPLTKPLMDRIGGGAILSRRNTDPTLLWMQESGYSISDPGPVLKLSDSEQQKYGEVALNTGGYRDILNPEQSRAVLEIAGPQIKQYLQSIQSDPAYSTFDKKQQERINSEVNKIRARAKVTVLLGY